MEVSRKRQNKTSFFSYYVFWRQPKTLFKRNEKVKYNLYIIDIIQIFVSGRCVNADEVETVQLCNRFNKEKKHLCKFESKKIMYR